MGVAAYDCEMLAQAVVISLDWLYLQVSPGQAPMISVLFPCKSILFA